jgi:hypothetical protein
MQEFFKEKDGINIPEDPAFSTLGKLIFKCKQLIIRVSYNLI